MNQPPKTLRLKTQKRMEPPEAKIQAAVIRRLQLEGWLVLRVNSGAHKTGSGGYFRAYIIHGLIGKRGRLVSSGFPDVLALRGDVPGGWFLLLEIKDHQGQLDEAQQNFRAFAARFGITVHIVRSPDDLEAIFQKESP